MKQSHKTLLLWVLLILMFLAIWQVLNPSERRQPVAFSEFMAEVHAGHVDEVKIKDREYSFRVRTGDTAKTAVQKETVGPLADEHLLETLKPEDYVAVVAYDMRPEILSDFSTDKRKAYEAMQRLRIPAFSESNLFDALTDTADRMSGIEGRKAIVLIASGIDTFSKLTFDKTRA